MISVFRRRAEIYLREQAEKEGKRQLEASAADSSRKSVSPEEGGNHRDEW